MYIAFIIGLIMSGLFIWLIPHGFVIFLIGFIIFVAAASFVPYASTLFMAPIWPFTIIWFMIIAPGLSKYIPAFMSSGQRGELAQAEYETLLKDKELEIKQAESFMKKWPEIAAWILWDQTEDPGEHVDYDRRGRDLENMINRPHELSDAFLSVMKSQARDMAKWGKFMKRYPKKYWICEPCSKVKNLIQKNEGWSSPFGVCSYCEKEASLMPHSHFDSF